MNRVFIATSMDGYIAGPNHELDWLDSVPELNEVDSGYALFMERVDALLMGRNTFDTVCGFGGEWPYTKPVFVWSNTLESVPNKLEGKVQLVHGDIQSVLKGVNEKGYQQLYIDGGKTIHSCLSLGLIDELIITVIPVVLGAGIPLFGALSKPSMFKCVEVKHFVNAVAQMRFVKK